MIHEAEFRAHLEAAVDRRLSLEDFEDWLDGASWGMHADSAPAAIRPAGEALLLLSEYGLGHRSESSVRAELRNVLERMAPQPQFFAIRVSIGVTRTDCSSMTTTAVRSPLVMPEVVLPLVPA